MRIAGILILLIFAVAFFVDRQPAAAAPGSPDKFTVFIYGDEVAFPRIRVGREIRRLEQDFGLDVLAYSVDNLKEFQSVLLQLTRSQVNIQNLIVRGIHGTNADGTPILEVRNNKRRDDIDFMNFGDPRLRGVRLNLTPTALVFFDSCSMVNNQSQEKILKAFKAVKKIGFTTGSIYLNHTDGNSAVANTFTVPFYEVPGDWKAQARVAAGQMIWPIVLPIFYYQQRYQENQGYLYQESAKGWRIREAYAGDIEDGV